MTRKLWPVGAIAAALVLAVPSAMAATGDREVSIGSPPSPFSQNKQNEPAIAMDASNESVLAAGSNDNIDMEACNAGDPTTCPFTAGIGGSGIYVSRTDDPATAALGGADGKAAWMDPVRVSQQSSATFADKEQIWADNAASSEFFGNVYVCWENFVGSGAGPLVVGTSRNGGDSWDLKKVTAAHAAAAKHWGQAGCTVRADSHGVVYGFYGEIQNSE